MSLAGLHCVDWINRKDFPLNDILMFYKHTFQNSKGFKYETLNYHLLPYFIRFSSLKTLLIL